MGNKQVDFYVRFIDPEEVQRATPAKRLECKAGPYTAGTVQQALSKFYKEYADAPGAEVRPDRSMLWPKGKIIVLDVMRSPKQVGPQMADEEDLPEEND